MQLADRGAAASAAHGQVAAGAPALRMLAHPLAGRWAPLLVPQPRLGKPRRPTQPSFPPWVALRPKRSAAARDLTHPSSEARLHPPPRWLLSLMTLARDPRDTDTAVVVAVDVGVAVCVGACGMGFDPSRVQPCGKATREP